MPRFFACEIIIFRKQCQCSFEFPNSIPESLAKSRILAVTVSSSICLLALLLKRKGLSVGKADKYSLSRATVVFERQDFATTFSFLVIRIHSIGGSCCKLGSSLLLILRISEILQPRSFPIETSSFERKSLAIWNMALTCSGCRMKSLVDTTVWETGEPALSVIRML